MPRYCIMDERAHSEIDDAVILEVCEEHWSLNDVIDIRNITWPGQCVVDMDTWKVIA